MVLDKLEARVLVQRVVLDGAMVVDEIAVLDGTTSLAGTEVLDETEVPDGIAVPDETMALDVVERQARYQRHWRSVTLQARVRKQSQ